MAKINIAQDPNITITQSILPHPFTNSVPFSKNKSKIAQHIFSSSL